MELYSFLKVLSLHTLVVNHVIKFLHVLKRNIRITTVISLYQLDTFDAFNVAEYLYLVQGQAVR